MRITVGTSWSPRMALLALIFHAPLSAQTLEETTANALSVAQNASSSEGFCRGTSIAGLPVTIQTKYARYKTTHNGISIEVHYVGTVHQGAPSFYDRIRRIFSQTHSVIEEGVLPSGFYGPPYLAPYYHDQRFDSLPAKIRQTRLRLFSIKNALEQYRAAHKKYPENLEDLHLLNGLGLYDAWGNPFIYTKDFDVLSLAPEASALSLKDGLAPPEKTILDAEKSTNVDYFENLKKLHPSIVHQPDLVPENVKRLVADVSLDLLSLGDIAELNKHLKLRDRLPSMVLEQVLKMNSKSAVKIGVHYGCGHAKEMDQRIRRILRAMTGTEADVHYEWLNVFGDDQPRRN